MFKLLIAALLVVAVSAKKTNEEGVNLIKKHEGFRPNFYGDPVGIRTIGYGHACHASKCSNIKPPITKEQGDKLLRSDLVQFENCVQKEVPSTNDNQFSALVSFAYNLGCGGMSKSDIVANIKKKNIKAAADAFGKYTHAKGKVLPGLVKRRNAEKKLFCTGGGC